MSFVYSFYYAPQYSKIEYWGAFYIKLTVVLGYNQMTASANFRCFALAKLGGTSV